MLCGKRCTSCGQPTATAIRPAQYRASASPGTSTTAKPPRCSLVSTYGPSVNRGAPLPGSTLHTTVDASRPPSLKTKTPAAVISSIRALAVVALSRSSSMVRSGTHSSLKAIRYSAISISLCSRAAWTSATHLPHERTHADPTPEPETFPGSSASWLRRLVVPTQPRALAFPAGTAAARVRHLAPAPAPARGLPSPAAFGKGDVRSARRRSLGRTRPPGAPRHRGDSPPPSAGGTGRADPAGAADRRDGRGRPVQPRDRPAAVPLAPLGRVTSVQALPEARRYLTRTARGDLPTRPRAIWLASAQP